MNNFLRPLYLFPSVASIPVSEIMARHPDLRAFSLDYDRFIAPHKSPDIPDEHLAKLAEMREAGLGLAITSNAHSEESRTRVRRYGANASVQIGHEIPVVTSWDAGRRKPFPPIFKLVADELGIEAGYIIHGGDQITRDVIGPNWAGYMGAVLVPPYGSADNEGKLVRYGQRPLEHLARFCMGLPLRDCNFPLTIQEQE